MKKTIALLAAPLFFGLGTTPLQASDALFYCSALGGVSAFNTFDVVSRDTGLNHGHITTSPGLDLAFAFGRKIGNFRLEAEYAFQRNNSGDTTITLPSGPRVVNLQGNFSIKSSMLNGYYDLKTGSIEPYITVGAGVATIGLNGVNDPPNILYEAHSTFGYQFGAGITIPIFGNLAIDARYRYFGTASATLDCNSDITINSHNFLTGLRLAL